MRLFLCLLILTLGCERWPETEVADPSIRLGGLVGTHECELSVDGPDVTDAVFDVAIGQRYPVALHLDTEVDIHVEQISIELSYLQADWTVMRLPDEIRVIDETFRVGAQMIGFELLSPETVREVASAPDLARIERTYGYPQGFATLMSADITIQGTTADGVEFTRLRRQGLRLCAGCLVDPSAGDCESEAEPLACPNRLGAEGQLLNCAQCEANLTDPKFALLCGEESTGADQQ